MRRRIAFVLSLLALGCAEDPPPRIEPEPAVEPEEPQEADEAEPEAEDPERVVARIRRDAEIAGFFPRVPLGFEAEDEDGPVYDRLARFLELHPRLTRVRIAVHSDPRGSRSYNLRVTRERARLVARQLVARGVDCERIEPVGYGEDRPLPDAEMDAQRRVELHFVEVDDTRLAPGEPEGPSACE